MKCEEREGDKDNAHEQAISEKKRCGDGDEKKRGNACGWDVKTRK